MKRKEYFNTKNETHQYYADNDSKTNPKYKRVSLYQIMSLSSDTRPVACRQLTKG